MFKNFIIFYLQDYRRIQKKSENDSMAIFWHFSTRVKSVIFGIKASKNFCYATDPRLRLLFCDVRSIYSKICVQYLYLNMKIKFQEPYEVITCILNSPLSDKLSKHTSDALHCTGDITYTVQHKPINFKISPF